MREWYFCILFMMNPAAPEGTPPRRIIEEDSKKAFLAPPCLGEALRRGTLAITMVSSKNVLKLG